MLELGIDGLVFMLAWIDWRRGGISRLLGCGRNLRDLNRNSSPGEPACRENYDSRSYSTRDELAHKASMMNHAVRRYRAKRPTDRFHVTAQIPVAPGTHRARLKVCAYCLGSIAEVPRRQGFV
jgi:hypothetical protein